MKKALPIGIVDYCRLKNENYYFVDKTMMIKEFLEKQSVVTLITRPRRFGKTLNMSMMAEFFDITKDSKNIFAHTAIVETSYMSQMNQYPTIFISFADAKRDQYSIVKNIKLQLRKEFERYREIVSNHLSEFDKDEYMRIKEGLLDLDDGHLENIDNALVFLMKKLEEHYKKKVMVFIDEYDTPFIEAHIHNCYDVIRDGLSSLLHNSLKTSTSLQYALLTGIQRVAKENIFSDLNNLVVYTVKDNEYSQYFGFTEDEVKTLLKYYNLELDENVKKMYDGYHMGNLEIYNPWSIINYALRKELNPYWINTSGNAMIKNAMSKRDSSFDDDYEMLLKNGYIDTRVTLETNFFETDTSSSLWALFINAGYLTIIEKIQRNMYRLKIPNQEVQEEFMNLTAYYLNVSDTLLDELFYALKTSNQELFKNKYQKIMETIPSYYDLKDENSYHMMMLGMCAWLSNEYEIISNKEEGKGRCDILLKSKNNQVSYVLEFKYCQNNKQLEKLAKEAIQQIKTQKYDVHIEGKTIYIGLAHCGKNVSVEWEEK
ncbi:MAG: AAA family ATPase [Longibaculum sp.]